uniref:Uncharacterized protein n=1 Tax=Oryza punctata TaxID=4537 RepID=A0A0E0ML37_ORYPU
MRIRIGRKEKTSLACGSRESSGRRRNTPAAPLCVPLHLVHIHLPATRFAAVRARGSALRSIPASAVCGHPRASDWGGGAQFGGRSDDFQRWSGGSWLLLNHTAAFASSVRNPAHAY